jgi:rare lipoprotein A
VASWYATGSVTASGAQFDPQALTAASPYLAFGTQLQVCVDSADCVVVTVNDRGPFVAGRFLDLTLGAAEELGYAGVGVAEVSATPVLDEVRLLPVAAAAPTVVEPLLPLWRVARELA